MLALSIGFSLVLAEGILRLLPMPVVQRIRSQQEARGQRREAHPPGLYRLHPRIGWTLTPGFSGPFRGPDFEIRVQANPEGLRDRPFAQGPSDSFRILGLGDSFAFGWGVAYDEGFLKVLERRLNEASPLEFEVINGGIPGYGTYEALQLLRWVGLDYEPDLVVLAFYEGNDYRNNGDAPRDRVIVDGQLRDATPPPTLVQGLLNRSVLASLVAAKASGLAQKRRFGADVLRTKELVGELVAELKQRGVPFAFLMIPDQDPEVYTRPPLLQTYDRLARGLSPVEARLELEAVCRAAGVPYIQLSSRFEGEGADLRLADTHLNRDGHAEAAGELLVALRSAGLLPSDPPTEEDSEDVPQ